jgi:hypothetical protein
MSSTKRCRDEDEDEDEDEASTRERKTPLLLDGTREAPSHDTRALAGSRRGA